MIPVLITPNFHIKQPPLVNLEQLKRRLSPIFQRRVVELDHKSMQQLLLLSRDHAIQTQYKAPGVIINVMIEQSTKNTYELTPRLLHLVCILAGRMFGVKIFPLQLLFSSRQSFFGTSLFTEK